MEHLNFTTELLGLKDKNIQIDAINTLSTHKEILAKLDYDAPLCPQCKGKTAKYDMQKPSRIPFLEVAGMKTVILLKKRRFKCKDCNRVFVAQTPLVKKNHQISEPTRFKILEKLHSGDSLTHISKELGVSTTTVYRKLKQIDIKNSATTLPKHLAWDEFAFMKGKMSFIAQDFDTNRIITILDGRTEATVKQFFYRFSYKERAKVETLTTDMYHPYILLAKKLFPNAKIILDRFHIIQHLGRAFNQTRIQMMNRLDRKSKLYKAIKRYWKLLQQDSKRLNHKRFYRPLFRQHLTNKEIVDWITSQDDDLNFYYELYQMLLAHYSQKDYKLFFELIQANYHDVNPRFKTTFDTFKKYKNEIKNAFELPYSNAKIEATNNLIKVIKRTAYGFRNFINFKKRIFLAINYKITSEPIILSRERKEKRIANHS